MMANARKRVRRGGKLSKATRKQITQKGRKEMPKSAFLVPSEMAYPVKVKDPKTGRWVLDANLLLAAEQRARSQGRDALANKARLMRIKLAGGK
jgi:hypothetical protein